MKSATATPPPPLPAKPDPAKARRLLLRAVPIAIAPVIAYTIVRPYAGSDTAGLAAAGAIPLTYSLVLVVWRRRIDPLAVLSSIGFALGCVSWLLLHGNSLPLKLHEAVVTFTIGLVLLVSVAIRRPIPIGKLLRLPAATDQLNSSLSVMIGGFLVLHALLHLALAVTLSTSSYLIWSRVINWSTLGIGAFCLSAYLRRLRSQQRQAAEPSVGRSHLRGGR